MYPQLNEINTLSLRLHGSTEELNSFTFGSLRDHVDEVKALLAAGDSHWKAEALDIIIHGYLLLERHGVGAEEAGLLMQRRLARFKEKVSR